MSSIRSTLIRSCFSNIQRELAQLEDWLNRDYAELPTIPTHSSTDGNIIYQAIQQLSKQLDSQQHTLHHIIDRIDVLEETRNVHIQEKDENNANNLWLDTEGVQLQNDLVDNEYDHIINVNKTEDVESKSPALSPVAASAPVEEPMVTPVVVEPMVVEPMVAPVVVEPVVIEPVVAPVVAPLVEKPSDEEQQKEEPVTEEPQEEEPQEEEQEEEEDGLEEIEYNGVTYYRDSNLIMYQLNEEGELTDPVGVWKEKSQTIKFYKK